MDLVLGETRISEYLFNWRNALAEHVNAEFFKLGSSNSEVKVFVFSKGIYLNSSLGG
jgi:hypothetical protein